MKGWPLGRRLTLWCLRACSRSSFLAFVILVRLARGDLTEFRSSSLAELRCSKSRSSGPLLVRSTKALAFFLCELNRPRMDDTNPSPARSLFLRGLSENISVPSWLPELSSEPTSKSSSIGPGCAGNLSLNFLPCRETRKWVLQNVCWIKLPFWNSFIIEFLNSEHQI